MIPFYKIKREYAAHRNNIEGIIGDVLCRGDVLNGPEVEQLEHAVADKVGRGYAVAVGSGSDALTIALECADIGPGDEVLAPAFGFIASAECILRVGATPVLVDEYYDYTMNLVEAASLISRKTRAMVFAHLFGRMRSPRGVENFATDNQLVLIEDAAQALGASYGHTKAGSLGLASCLSFSPTKPLSALGTGGMILTDCESLADSARQQRYHGRNRLGWSFNAGHNSQLSTASAAVLLYKLDLEFSEWLPRRGEIARGYLEGLDEFRSGPPWPSGCDCSWSKFALRRPERDALRKHLGERGIETAIHYPHGLHKQPCFRTDRDFPVANQLSREALSLPIHAFLSDNEVDQIVRAVNEFKSAA